MPNMRDISKLSGVSLSSVSRILSGDPMFRVREDTRVKVLDAARQLQYTCPPPRSRGEKIGCILSFTAEKYSDKYFLTIISAVERKLRGEGYALSSLYASGEMEKTEKAIARESLSGLLLFDDSLLPNQLERLKRAVPNLIGVDTDFPTIDNVSCDNYRIGVQAMEHLTERGHTRIAYIGGAEHVLSGRERAYADQMAVRGLPILPGYIMDCGWEPERCHDMTLRLCRSGNRPTAIFAGSDNLAIAVLNAVHALGLSTPGDVAVAGVNNLDFSAYTSPALTTVSIPMEEIGSMAAELLLRRINGFAGSPIKIIYPATLIVRSST